MFGKIFSSMFEGSLYGKGWGPFLVMAYAIANGVPDKEVGMQVDLNPKALADKFGEKEQDVRKAIEFLCQPDPDTTTTEEGGRRLIKIGAFAYKVVNGMKYRAIRDEESRREQVRLAMARHRAKNPQRRWKPLPGAGLIREDTDTGELADRVNAEQEANRREKAKAGMVGNGESAPDFEPKELVAGPEFGVGFVDEGNVEPAGEGEA